MNDLGASVIARLKAKSQKEGLQLQLLLNLFCQEEFLRRIQNSKYNENLVLKGGFLIYTITEFEGRPTIDADYLLQNYSNSIKDINEMVKNIITVSSENDFITFEIRGSESIAEHREYNGVRINLIGFIKDTKTPFSVDFGVGDIIVPDPIKKELPVLLSGFKNPKILTYSLESTIAEKFDAIISRMELTGRMKDFFDIYYLASRFDFEGIKLQEAIFKTLENRGTYYDKNSLQHIKNLINNDDILKRWNLFCKKILHFQIDFKEIIEMILKFLELPFNAIIDKHKCKHDWNSDQNKYIQ